MNVESHWVHQSQSLDGIAHDKHSLAHDGHPVTYMLPVSPESPADGCFNPYALIKHALRLKSCFPCLRPAALECAFGQQH